MDEAAENLVVGLISSRKYAEALSLLQRYLSTDPNDYFSNYHAGSCLRFLGQLDEAIDHYELAVRLMPRMASPQLGLGIAYQLKGNFDAAIAALRRAIELNPDFIEAYNSLGLTYRKMNQPRLALDSYENGIDRLSQLTHTAVHRDPARCYRIDSAGVRTVLPYVFSETLRLLKSNVLYAVMCNNMGVCLNLLGDPEQARKRFEEAIECTPDGYDYQDPVQNLNNLA